MPGRNAFGSITSTATVAHDLPVAQVHNQKRQWEKDHPARRYLIPVDLRDEVAAMAETLMENVDPLACVLFDYAAACHARGTLKFQPRLNPKGRKHTLSWEDADDEPIQIPIGRHRSVKKADTHPRSLKGQTAAYRLGKERHAELKTIADTYNLRLADILSAFFRHSLQAYQNGKLKIRREPVVMKLQIKGWSE